MGANDVAKNKKKNRNRRKKRERVRGDEGQKEDDVTKDASEQVAKGSDQS